MADPIVISDSDDEDEQMKQAIALSLADAQKESSKPAEPAPAAGGLSALFPDRKAMEEARLARARKRTRSISPPNAARKAPKLDETSVDRPSGARLNMVVQADQATRKDPVARAASARMGAAPPHSKGSSHSQPTAVRSSPGDVIYPHGVVKKTWAFGHDRTGDDIKLEEVLEPSTLRTAVLSAFQWNTEWVFNKLLIPPRGGSTKCVFVMQGKERELREDMLEQIKEMRGYLRLCFPPMEGQTHCMHSKLQLLFHPKKLRIAIPTANLLNFDWGETGMMENSVWLIDLPRLDPGKTQDEGDLPAFGGDLIHFLRAQTLDKDIIKGLLNFDFSATQHIAFVHSVGGISEASDAERTGLPGLARAVRALKLQSNDLQVDFAASSIGSLKDAFLVNLYDACRGEDMSTRDTAPAKADFFKPASSKKSEPKPKGIRERFHIYFPTKETVRASTAGAAGTICLSRQWFEDMPFPRSIFRDYVSTRRGLLSHNKNLFARGKQQMRPDDPIQDIAWAYVGSANMSESAWGKMIKDKKGKQPRVNCRNWECGVVLPALPRKSEGEGAEADEESDDLPTKPGPPLSDAGPVVGMDVFDGVVKPPFVYPSREYGNREPWYFKEFQESRPQSSGDDGADA